MFKKRKEEILIADFETTVNKVKTEVWSAASINLALPTKPENVIIQTSIEDFMEFIFRHNDTLIYFHNLKFDGSFILAYLMDNEEFSPYQAKIGDTLVYKADNFFGSIDNTYTYTISDTGVWYEIKIAKNGHIYRFVDSLKLLPFSVDDIGKGFDTKYKKLNMEYKGDMHAGGIITKEQESYIKHDVLVMHEAIKIMRKRGHKKTTIGACCLAEFKKGRYGSEYNNFDYRNEFPDLYKIDCPFEGYDNADDFIRQSYHGGFTAVVKGKENKVFKDGCTYDYNSMYPSQMIAHEYPYGEPIWFEGAIPKEAREPHKYFFVRIKTRFYLKEGFLPTVQVKGNVMYDSREWLSTSDIKGKKFYIDVNGNIKPAVVEMVLTQTDFQLLMDHYKLVDCVILGGCYFNTKAGIFDSYINEWAEKKITAPNKTEKLIAKLFLNNLYGKFSQNNKSSYKIYELGDDHIMKSRVLDDPRPKEPGYIAIGSAITSYGRETLLAAGQENYEHLIYMDTDSIHCDCAPDEVKGIPIDPKKLGHWKCETSWSEGIFVRAKSYIERVIEEDGEKVEEPYYNIKCAGMGTTPKAHFEKGLLDGTYKLTDFKKGLTLPDNLKARLVDGGTVLFESEYKMR